MHSFKCYRMMQRLKPYLPYLIGLTTVTGIILTIFGDQYVFVNVNDHKANDKTLDTAKALVNETGRNIVKRTAVSNIMVDRNVTDNISKTGDKATISVNKSKDSTLHKNEVVGNSHNFKVGNGNLKTPLQTLPPPEYFSKYVCNIEITEEMDLMKMKKLPFIQRFKNPCWHDQGSKLKCLPYFYIVGVAKSGTTDLFHRISYHPDVISPTRKEPNWLTDGRFYRQESFNFYVYKYFSPISEALSRINGTSNLITGDASVFDLHGGYYWPSLGKNIGHDEPVENNAEYIYHMNSQARILVNLRNPIDRLWSEYLALSQSKNLSAESFHEVVKTAIRVYQVCQQTRTLRSCMYDTPLSLYASRFSVCLMCTLNQLGAVFTSQFSLESSSDYMCTSQPKGRKILVNNMLAVTFQLSEEERHTPIRNCRYHGAESVMLLRGVYHVFIKDYLKVFPREHVLIQRLEDISNDTESALVRTYNFLDLDIPSEKSMKIILSLAKQNPRRASNLGRGDMLETTRRLLYEFYRPHNEQLSVLLGDSKFNYGPRS